MCSTLEVSRSGLYAAFVRHESNRNREDFRVTVLIREEHEKRAAPRELSGDRAATYGRVVRPGEVDVAHGAILYLDDITVSFDGFKALNALSLSISALSALKPSKLTVMSSR